MVATCLGKDRHHALALRMLGNDGQCLHVCVAHHSQKQTGCNGTESQLRRLEDEHRRILTIPKVFIRYIVTLQTCICVAHAHIKAGFFASD